MQPYTLTLLAGLGYGALALWVLLLAWRDRGLGLAPVWGLLAVALAVSAVWAPHWGAQGLDTGLRLEPGALLLDGLRQLALLLCLMQWLGLLRGGIGLRQRWSGPRMLVLLMAAAALLVQTAAALRWLDRGSQLLAPWYAGLVLAIVGLVLVEQVYRGVAEHERWNIKPLCLGLATIYGFDLYLFSEALLLQGQEAQTLLLRPVVHALALPLLLVGTWRGRLLPGRLAQIGLSRDAAFHSAALLLAGVYLMLAAALGYWLRLSGGAWGLALQLLLMVSAAVLLGALLMSGSLRARLRVWLAKHFLRYRYDYRQEWLRFTAALTDPDAGSDTGAALIRALGNLVESRGGGLWRDDAGQQVQVAHWNHERLQARVASDSDFVARLQARNWILDLDVERRAPPDSGAMPDWLRDDAEAWLVVPLIAAGRLQAWAVLTRPRTPFPLNWEVYDLLRTAATQAAGFLAMLRASDELLEARKFDAFNRMSAFVVHDLKNIVTQLSLMLKNAERHGDKPAFRADMLETVDHAVEKMRLLMTQLREGERGAVGSSGVALQPLLERLRAQALQQGRALRLQIDEPLSTRGQAARVERVIGHAVQNAFDASADGAEVQLRLARWGSYARLEVVDQGSGMSAEFVRERLFKPFQSTKAHGMGVGAYECQQLVQEMGGKIEVESEPGRGTTMRFLLPLLHTRSE